MRTDSVSEAKIRREREELDSEIESLKKKRERAKADLSKLKEKCTNPLRLSKKESLRTIAGQIETLTAEYNKKLAALKDEYSRAKIDLKDFDCSYCRMGRSALVYGVEQASLKLDDATNKLKELQKKCRHPRDAIVVETGCGADPDYCSICGSGRV